MDYMTEVEATNLLEDCLELLEENHYFQNVKKAEALIERLEGFLRPAKKAEER